MAKLLARTIHDRLYPIFVPPASTTAMGWDISFDGAPFVVDGQTQLIGCRTPTNSLTSQAGLTVSQSGTVGSPLIISNFLFTNAVTVTGSNIIIRDCLMKTNGNSGGRQFWVQNGASNVRFEFVTATVNNIDTQSVGWNAVSDGGSNNGTFYRCFFRNGGNCLSIYSNGCLVDECLFLNPSSFSDPGDHRDCIEIYGGDNHVVRRSKLVMRADETSCVNVAPFGGGHVENVDVYENYLSGGNMHTLIDNQAAYVRRVRFRRNRMTGDTTRFFGAYFAFNNSDGRTRVETEAQLQANPEAYMWPINTPTENNVWYDQARYGLSQFAEFATIVP